MSARDARFLIIVARRERSLHMQLEQLFEDNERVEVVFDRRFAPSMPRPHGEQRTLDVEASLRTFGWAIVARPGTFPRETAERQAPVLVELIRAL